MQQAYRVLEDSGLAMPRPKSGTSAGQSRTAGVAGGRSSGPAPCGYFAQWDQVLELIRAVPRKDVVQLGRGMPDITSPTMKPLLRDLARISRRQDVPGLYYDNIHGNLELRQANCPPDARFRLSARAPANWW